MPINHVLSATTPDDPAWEIRPSHWNSNHSIALVGSEVSGAFSNGGNVSFGLSANGFITASANVTAAPSPVNVTGANGSSVNAQTIQFGNANGMSLGVSTAANGATITGSYTVPAQTAFVFSNSNGVSFGTNGSTVTATVATNYQSQGAYLTTAAQSNQVVNSLNGSTGQISLNAGSSLSASTNGSSITFGLASNITTALQSAGAYLTTARASNDAIGLNSAVSNVTATINSSGLSLDARGYAGTVTSNTGAGSFTLNSNGLAFNGGGLAGTSTGFTGVNVSGSMTLNTAGLALSLSAGAGGGGNFSAGVSGGNTSGQTGVTGTRLVFAGGNNITLSQGTDANGATITVSGANAGGAQTGISSIIVSNTTYTSGAISFSNANGISFGSSAGQAITASYTVPTAYVSSLNGSSGAISLNVGSSLSSSTNGSSITFGLASNITTALQSAGAYLTTQSAQAFSASGGSSAFQTLSFTNSNGFTFSNTNGSVVGSYTVPSVTAFFSNTATTFNGANISGSITMNTNGLQLSLSAAAPGAAAEQNAVNLLGANTSGNTTASGSTLGFSGVNLTLSGTNASQIVFSAPATSSLSATGQVSISTNGATISIGVPNARTETNGFFPYGDLELVNTQIGNGSMIIDPNAFPTMACDRVLVPIYVTNGAASTGSQSLSFWIGIYSRNASTLSLYASASQTYAVTMSGTVGNYSQFSAMRNITIPMTTTITEGKYWIAFASRTSSAGTDASYSNQVLSQNSNSYGGVFGQASNASNQFTLGQGFYSATTSGIPSSIAFSQIQGTASNAQRMQAVMFASGTA